MMTTTEAMIVSEPEKEGGAGAGGGMGGMGGGGPEADLQRQSQQLRADHEQKNAGEVDDGGFKWEQTSSGGETEILIRFVLETPATKKDVKVVFTSTTLVVTVAGVELLNGKTFMRTHPDESTWCLVDKGAELQVQLCSSSDAKWAELLLKE